VQASVSRTALRHSARSMGGMLYARDPRGAFRHVTRTGAAEHTVAQPVRGAAQ